MRRILLFGNSGSEKSTQASRLSSATMAHLDLDTLAELPSRPPQRMPLSESRVLIDQFTANNGSWVIEGLLHRPVRAAGRESHRNSVPEPSARAMFTQRITTAVGAT